MDNYLTFCLKAECIVFHGEMQLSEERFLGFPSWLSRGQQRPTNI